MTFKHKHMHSFDAKLRKKTERNMLVGTVETYLRLKKTPI